MQSVLGFLIALVLLCDLAVLGIHVLDSSTDLVSGGPVVTVEPGVRPSAGQAFVDGVLERLSADNAQGAALKTPLTVEAVERGVGRLTIDNALVGGRRVTIVWDGGTPLPISGAGGLELGPSHVEVDAKGVVWQLDGGGRKFQPGTYRLGASVAVGAAGIAASRDGVEFTADDQTVASARGNVVVKLGPQRVELRGPGKLDIKGTLEVQYPSSKTKASSVRFGEGPFELTVDPAGGTLQLSGLLQGDVDTG